MMGRHQGGVGGERLLDRRRPEAKADVAGYFAADLLRIEAGRRGLRTSGIGPNLRHGGRCSFGRGRRGGAGRDEQQNKREADGHAGKTDG